MPDLRRCEDGAYVDIVDAIDEMSGTSAVPLPKKEPQKTVFLIENATPDDIGVGDNSYMARIYFYQKARRLHPLTSINHMLVNNSMGRELKAIAWARKNICEHTGRTMVEVIDAYLSVKDEFLTGNVHSLYYLSTAREGIMLALKRSGDKCPSVNEILGGFTKANGGAINENSSA
jgi:hypothetical protein